MRSSRAERRHDRPEPVVRLGRARGGRARQPAPPRRTARQGPAQGDLGPRRSASGPRKPGSSMKNGSAGSIPGSGPRRMCVGCRDVAGKADLLRVVAVDGAVVPDPRATLPGRGAYVHPDRDCVDLAVRRRAFGRALRVPGPIDTEPLFAWIDLRRSGSRSTPAETTDPSGAPDEHPMSRP